MRKHSLWCCLWCCWFGLAYRNKSVMVLQIDLECHCEWNTVSHCALNPWLLQYNSRKDGIMGWKSLQSRSWQHNLVLCDTKAGKSTWPPCWQVLLHLILDSINILQAQLAEERDVVNKRDESFFWPWKHANSCRVESMVDKEMMPSSSYNQAKNYSFFCQNILLTEWYKSR